MPQAIATFRHRHPVVALTLAEGEPEEIAPRLRAGEFDLALLFEFPGTRERHGARLRTQLLFEDPMLVALPADHALAGKPALNLDDLREDDWVQTSASSPCARHVVRLCLAAGFEPKVTFESDDYEMVQGLVAAGVGVALIPRLALTRVHPGIVVRALAPKSPMRRVVAATLGAAGVSPAAEQHDRDLDRGGQALHRRAEGAGVRRRRPSLTPRLDLARELGVEPGGVGHVHRDRHPCPTVARHLRCQAPAGRQAGIGDRHPHLLGGGLLA